MGLFEEAQKLSNDRSLRLSNKRWQSYLLAAKLRDLRTREHLSQTKLAEISDISQSNIRNYETQKSSPKKDHLNALAKALDVRPEALNLYDIDFTPAHALFQLGETYGLEPYSDPRFAYLSPTSDFLKHALKDWAEQYRKLKESNIDCDSYEQWKDKFYADFDPKDFPLRYEKSGDGYVLIEPWENIQFAEALQRLRDERGLTQEDLSKATGISKSTVRSYEQRKRLPRNSQLETIASVLEVMPGTLTFFNFGSPVQAMHALFQIANRYGLIPDVLDNHPMLRTIRPGLEQIIDQWDCALHNRDYRITNSSSADTYQNWKDTYNWEQCRAMHESRYRNHFNFENAFDGMESDYDPYDENYKDGFLRA